MSFFFVSSRRRHTRCALVTGVQTCALPISMPQQAHGVAQAVLATVAAVELEPRGAGWQVELVMRKQRLLGFALPVALRGGHRLARPVPVGGRLQLPYLLACHFYFALLLHLLLVLSLPISVY